MVNFARVTTRVFVVCSLFQCFKAWTQLNPRQAMDNFPKTLKEFGYGFNERGQLRRLDKDSNQLTDQPFKFDVLEGNHHYNQRHYEALGEVINEHVYELLEKEGNLVKHDLDGGSSDPNEQKAFIFTSKDIFENTDKLLVLIHGSGVVRAGQWARRLIINDNLETGTQLPFIKKAQEDGYAVIVTNTNDNSRLVNGKKKLIRDNLSTFLKGSENPANHLLTVWEEVIEKSPAKSIAFIAHSYGGVCVLQLASHIAFDKFRNRVFAIAMTDSVHNMAHHDTIDSNLRDLLCKIGRNWVSSGKELDAAISSSKSDIERVSAGHAQHEMTSYSSKDSVFKFLDEKLRDFLRNNSSKNHQSINEDGQEKPSEKKSRLDEL